LAINAKTGEADSTYLDMCLNELPQGYDAVLKCCEILLFYLVLFVIIFLISPFAALLTLIAVPLLILLLVIKNRKEVHVTHELRDNRRKIREGGDDYETVISLSSQRDRYNRISTIHAEFFGGIALVLLMLIFLLNFTGQDLNSLAALAMVFAIRFAINYARELSRHASRLLQQRVVIDKIDGSPFH